MDKYLNASDYTGKIKQGQLKAPKINGRKSLTWYKKYSKHIYAMYASNSCGIGSGGILKSNTSIAELRLYAKGKQPESKYMKIIDDLTPNAKGETETYANISWRNVMLFPKFREIMKAKLLERNYSISTQANDPLALFEKRFKIQQERMLRSPIAKDFQNRSGIPPTTKTDFPKIESEKDFETLQKMGGIRLKHEIMLKDALDSILYDSDFEEIRSMLIDDILDLELMAWETYLEKATGLVKKKYIDPARLVFRDTIYPDGRDNDFRGYIESKTISQFRQESNLKEKDIHEIYTKYCNHGSNSKSNWNGNLQESQNHYAQHGNYPYDSAKIDVLTYYIIAGEVEDEVIGEGNLPETEHSENYIPKESNEKVIQNVYKCSYVIGTSFVYNFGLEYGIVRQGEKGSKKAELPITIYAGNSPSMVEKCIPHIDDIQLAVLKKRNFMRKLAPGPRLAFDMSIMEQNVTIGTTTYNMLEMTELFIKTGIFLYRSVGDYQSKNEGSIRKPVEPINIDIFSEIQLFASEIEMQLDLMRQVTGVNPVADGTSKKHDMLKSVQEGLLEASNSALFPLIMAFERFIERGIRHAAKKFQLSVLTGEINIKYQPFSERTIKSFSLTKEIEPHDYGIQIKLLPSEADKQLMFQNLQEYKQKGLVTPDVEFIFMQMVKDNDIRKAQLYLAEEIQKREKLNFEREQAIQQAVGKANADAAVVTAEEARKTLDFSAKIEMAKMKYERGTLLLVEQEKGKQRMKQLGEKAQTETEKSIVEKITDKQLGNQAASIPQKSESNDDIL